MKRALDVVRIQTVYWPGIIGWPVGILALAFAANLVIFGAIGDRVPAGDRTTGGLASIYVVVLIAYIQSMTQVFPFAIGLGVTRRAFLAGTALLGVAQAVTFGGLLLMLRQVEKATDGWGIGLGFFGVDGLVQDNVAAQWLAYTVPFLVLVAVGIFVGVIFKRWGVTGVYVAMIITVVALVGATMLVTWRDWWSEIGSFLTTHSSLALVAGYPLILAVAVGGATVLAIGRATP